MHEKELNEKIRIAVEHAAPDKLHSILSSVSDTKGETAMTKTTKRKPLFAIAAAAAVFLLCVGLIGYNGMQSAVDSVITLDVNPSIEIEANRRDKVIEVNALNEDAKTVIGDMNFRGTDLDVTVNALIGSMLRNGFITDMQNAVLITVENDDDEKSLLLTHELSDIVDKAFKAETIEGAVISQTAKIDDDTHALAEQLGISDGKAALVNEVAKQDENLTPEALANLSVGEILLISDSKNITPDTVQKTGATSEKAYIGRDKALEIAKAEAAKSGETETAFTDIEVEFDSEKGKMVYEIEFESTTVEYEYDIDAVSGKIIKGKRHGKPQPKPAETTKPVEQPAETKPVETKPAETKPVETKPTEPKPVETKPVPSFIGNEEALAKALAHAGVAKADAFDISVELDEDDGRVHYDVDFDTKTTDYDYEIGATDGEILKAERDDRDDDDDDDRDDRPVIVTTAAKTLDKEGAKALAFDHAGVNAADVRDLEVEFDEDDGRHLFEIEFQVGRTEYSYEIALDGTILKAEKDIDD